MPYDVCFEDDSGRTIVLASKVEQAQAFEKVRYYNAEARKKGLKVVKVPWREREFGAWEHVGYRKLRLPPGEVGRLYVLVVEES